MNENAMKERVDSFQLQYRDPGRLRTGGSDELKMAPERRIDVIKRRLRRVCPLQQKGIVSDCTCKDLCCEVWTKRSGTTGSRVSSSEDDRRRVFFVFLLFDAASVFQVSE